MKESSHSLLDVSKRMLGIAEDRCKKAGLKVDDVLYFDSYPLPFPDNSFDVILTLETLEHMPYPGKFVNELSRMLKPGGIIKDLVHFIDHFVCLVQLTNQ